MNRLSYSSNWLVGALISETDMYKALSKKVITLVDAAANKEKEFQNLITTYIIPNTTDIPYDRIITVSLLISVSMNAIYIKEHFG